MAGYARVMAKIRVQQAVNKPFFGKPYLKLGQCYAIWGYFLQLGGILGGRHSGNLDAFGPAFLEAKGPPGAVRTFFINVATHLMDSNSVRDSMGFLEYVGSEFTKRVHYGGDAHTYFAEHGLDKMSPGTAEELAWQYSETGAALGAIHHQMVRQMFIQTHAAVPKDKWHQMRAAGLNLSPEQDAMSYEETEKGEHDAFMLYCRECCPDLYAVLNK
jgi:hypothetical protein